MRMRILARMVIQALANYFDPMGPFPEEMNEDEIAHYCKELERSLTQGRH
jgi:hypothetical protein